MVYLLGPGRANEHADQHILAGTEDIAGPDFFGGRTLTHHEALRAGKRLDLDRLEHGTEIVSTRTRRDYEAQEMTSAERGPAHIWHCSLTLHPDEAALSDETWAALAREFVDEMGFTAASGKAACRWVAVRQGVNAGGGDHIHIAVNLVREDGTKASVWRDWPRAQAACNTLEHRYGLAVVESREHQRGVRGESPDEQAAARRDGQALTDRARLEIALHAAASGDAPSPNSSWRCAGLACWSGRATRKARASTSTASRWRCARRRRPGRNGSAPTTSPAI